MEMSFGKLYRYNQKYPSPALLPRELQLDSNRVTVEQLLGPGDDWFRIYSTADFYEMDAAREEAQRVWSQASVHSLYKAGKIRRARYGIEEVETRYRRWFGGLDDPEQPWHQEPSREEHMADLAMRETLAYALDVDGFRELLGFSPENQSDDELLARLHEIRARSDHVPANARTESVEWLKHRKDKAEIGG